MNKSTQLVLGILIANLVTVPGFYLFLSGKSRVGGQIFMVLGLIILLISIRSFLTHKKND